MLEDYDKQLLAIAALALCFALEQLAPAYRQRSPRFAHDARNLLLGGFNALVVPLLFASALFATTQWAQAQHFGLLNWAPPPPAITLVVAILVIDAWQYAWHRLNHRLVFLWRFHLVHHADAAMNVTTAVRFHSGEIVLSALARLAVLPLLGVTTAQLLVYEAILLPVILFHHSNLLLPQKLDRALRALIVTPGMHRVHHSTWQPETDSNYSSIFSFWDRLFHSYRRQDDYQTITLGLQQIEERQWNSLSRLLALPFSAAARQR